MKFSVFESCYAIKTKVFASILKQNKAKFFVSKCRYPKMVHTAY